MTSGPVLGTAKEAAPNNRGRSGYKLLTQWR